MAGLLDFLGLGATAGGLGPVGGQRQLPQPIPSFDPSGQQPFSPLAALTGIGPMAQTDPAAREQALSGIASSTPNMNSGGGGLRGFLGLGGDGFGGVRGALGQVGDYLLQANGMQPIYAGRQAQHKQRQLGDAMAQFVGADDMLAQVMREDPAAGAKLLEMRQKTTGDPFTLGEGQVRYDARGNIIAQGPEGSPDVTVIDGVAYDRRTGDPLFESPYPRIISGTEGAFYEQPRLGLGRHGAQEDGQAPMILRQATARGYVLPDELSALRQQLGPNGQGAMDGWLQQNGVRVAARTGTAPDGRKVVQFEDGTVEYAD